MTGMGCIAGVLWVGFGPCFGLADLQLLDSDSAYIRGWLENRRSREDGKLFVLRKYHRSLWLYNTIFLRSPIQTTQLQTTTPSRPSPSPSDKPTQQARQPTAPTQPPPSPPARRSTAPASSRARTWRRPAATALRRPAAPQPPRRSPSRPHGSRSRSTRPRTTRRARPGSLPACSEPPPPRPCTAGACTTPRTAPARRPARAAGSSLPGCRSIEMLGCAAGCSCCRSVRRFGGRWRRSAATTSGSSSLTRSCGGAA